MSTEIASAGVLAAHDAGLRYTSDEQPGIRRVRRGRGFGYRGPDGRTISDHAELRRIRALAIPPAWTDVWISPSPLGHIQATGRDARGRKQYRYHPRWRQVRDEAKYARLADFAAALPRIRARVDLDLARPGVPREKMLAAAVRILEETVIRIGNAEYAKANKSFGLTTLRNKHVDVEGTRLVFRFRGKSGKEHEVDLRDRRLAGIVSRLQELPGQDLFQYLDDEGTPRPIFSDDVNEYLREIAGDEISAKEFRTWAGTLLAAETLARERPARNERVARRRISGAIDVVAKRLGNTRTVCRQCYVHPAILAAYERGSLPAALRRPERESRSAALSSHESAVASLLVRSARRSSRRAA